MNDSLIKDYLTFFKNEKVDLRNEGINEKIDFYFERTSFLNDIEILENNSLIIETEHGNCTYLITEKGEKYLKQITIKLDYETEKERIEFEKSKIDLELNKWLLKTKWLPHIITVISLLFAVYVYFDSKNDSKKLEERIEKLESKILIPKNVSKK